MATIHGGKKVIQLWVQPHQECPVLCSVLLSSLLALQQVPVHKGTQQAEPAAQSASSPSPHPPLHSTGRLHPCAATRLHPHVLQVAKHHWELFVLAHIWKGGEAAHSVTHQTFPGYSLVAMLQTALGECLVGE